MCAHLVLPRCLPSDLICISLLLENLGFVRYRKSINSLRLDEFRISFSFFSSHRMGKEDTDKKWWKRKRREWWKKEEKASLMFPAKIFRLLLHDASPCPTHTRTLTHSHMYTRSREPFLSLLPRVPHGGVCKSWRPYLTMLNFLFTRSSDSWLVNYLGMGTRREIQRVEHKDHM